MERGSHVYVFPAFGQCNMKQGTKKARGYATGAFRRAVERAGLNAEHLVQRYGRFTFHSLRDTFATRLVDEGLDLDEVSKLLGHTTIQMTMKYVNRVGGKHVDKAREAMNRRRSAREQELAEEAVAGPLRLTQPFCQERRGTPREA